jgi:hypothetical protein
MLTPNMRCVDTPSRTHILRIFSLPFFFSKQQCVTEGFDVGSPGASHTCDDWTLGPPSGARSERVSVTAP